MDPEIDIAVVGGGVVGCAVASALARAKHAAIASCSTGPNGVDGPYS